MNITQAHETTQELYNHIRNAGFGVAWYGGFGVQVFLTNRALTVSEVADALPGIDAQAMSVDVNRDGAVLVTVVPAS